MLENWYDNSYDKSDYLITSMFKLSHLNVLIPQGQLRPDVVLAKMLDTQKLLYLTPNERKLIFVYTLQEDVANMAKTVAFFILYQLTKMQKGNHQYMLCMAIERIPMALVSFTPSLSLHPCILLYYFTFPSHYRIDMVHDVFGRERHKLHSENMGGVGSFEKDCRTLYVGHLGKHKELENTLWKEFGEWGEIEVPQLYSRQKSLN